VGWLLSFEKRKTRTPTPSWLEKGTTAESRQTRVSSRSCVVSEPAHAAAVTSLARRLTSSIGPLLGLLPRLEVLSLFSVQLFSWRWQRQSHRFSCSSEPA